MVTRGSGGPHGLYAAHDRENTPGDTDPEGTYFKSEGLEQLPQSVRSCDTCRVDSARGVTTSGFEREDGPGCDHLLDWCLILRRPPVPAYKSASRQLADQQPAGYGVRQDRQ
jgi:hypothetical protein